jgi:uncharacterized protein (TIGR04255 family)
MVNENDESAFPPSERIIYEKNPLFEVICQLRFPTILRIESEIPTAFQERIRERYPLFREKSRPELPSNIPPQLAKFVGEFVAGVPKSYDFLSADEKWIVGLTKDFVSLSTPDYVRWEDFRERLRFIANDIKEVYKPSFCTRIGLRYRNAIRRSLLSGADASWTRLLRPEILGELGDERIAPRIVETSRTTRVDLGRDSFVRIQHGLGKDDIDGEVVFVIDADFYTESQTELSDVFSRLDWFNKESGRLFRWSITKEVHEAMGPRPVG